MCFHKRKKDKIQTAEKDITVYKVVETYRVYRKTIKSSYYNFVYRFNKLYKENISSFKDSVGFHSYSRVLYRKEENYINEDRAIVIADKLNSNPYKDYNQYSKGVIIECTIPKGSKYIFNGTDYISNQIIINYIVLPPDNLYKLLPESFRYLIEKHYTIS